METPAADIPFFQRAIELALAAEEQGNLPIGAVICLDGEIIGEGKNAIWYPTYNQNRHAEVEALQGELRARGGAPEWIELLDEIARRSRELRTHGIELPETDRTP